MKTETENIFSKPLVELITLAIEEITDKELALMLEERESGFITENVKKMIFWRNEELNGKLNYSINELAEGIVLCKGVYYFFYY